MPNYADALKILGKDDSAVLDFAEKLVDGGLGALGVPDLFGLRSELVAKGRELLGGIRERITGVSRWDRTQRIEAAHRILLVTSFIEALDEVIEDPGSPVDWAELGLDDEETRSWLVSLVDSQYGVVASPSVPLVPDHGDHWGGPYKFLPRFVRSLGSLSRTHNAPGTLRRLDETRRTHLSEMLGNVATVARRRYEESYRQLAADVPEFGVWVNLAEHRATREGVDQLATGLRGLNELLVHVSPGAKLERRRAELAALYRRTLDRPVLSSADAPEGFALPTLEEAYLNPRGRIATTMSEDQPATDSWWEIWPLHDDLQGPLVSFLTQSRATESPLVVLGHPGAGKSKLTEMLAARLPSGDFLPVRIELRSVQADASIRRQIEEGISATLHTDVAWRDLVESADGALPVVILDGFDELLQATGVNRSDYLEQVQQFQQDQAVLGHPVAVIVTSRTVVAERARFPISTTVIRLEPFDEAQIARMLDVWSTANASILAAQGLKPLPLETVLRHRELAEQPLLLLMLLIYDADGNALQQADADLGRADLYEELLTAFARREVRKHKPHLTDTGMDQAVEDELRRLEVVAMAMFARHRQSVEADELGRDLAALFPDSAVRPADAGMHGAVSDADQVLGRFFFVHESQARQDSQRRSVYEFLHATFGEYLVARTVVATLDDLVADRLHAQRRRRHSGAPDDGRLHALTCFAALAGRAAVVEFTEDLLARDLTGRPEDRADYRTLLVELFRDALHPNPNRSAIDYEPCRATIPQRLGTYTANLAVLLALVAQEDVDLAELYPDAAVPWQEWRGLAGLWRSMPGDDWHGTLDAVRVRHLGYWSDENPRTVLCKESGDPVNIGECVGFELHADAAADLSITDPYGITVPYEGVTSRVLRSMAVRAHGSVSRSVLMLGPYLANVGADVSTWLLDPETDTAWTEVHDILELRLAPPGEDPDGRIRRYARLLSNSRKLGRLELTVLRQAAEEFGYLSAHPAQAEALRSLVGRYLGAVTSVIAGPRLSSRIVGPVLAALRPHIEAPETLDRIGEIVVQNDDLEPTGSEDRHHRYRLDVREYRQTDNMGGSAG
ncbi:NACHT domain-containing protein [Spinactinospora alkalitolerans]|nr:ATP-binding protein [Spinactinospora alkalitolerans]